MKHGGLLSVGMYLQHCQWETIIHILLLVMHDHVLLEMTEDENFVIQLNYQPNTVNVDLIISVMECPPC